MDFDFTAEQKAFVAEVERFLDENHDPEVMDPADPAMLQDLVLAAVNEATRKVDEAMQSKLGAFSGGLPRMT